MTKNSTVGRIINYLALGLAALCLLVPFYAAAKEKKDAVAVELTETEKMEKKWGIKALSIRQTAEGYMLDFRYRVIDEKKAAPLFGSKIKPYLIDEASGAVMAVPNVPKVGSMRSTRKPVSDRNYAILFANPQKYIKPGSKVTVVIGEFKASNLVVE